MAGSRWTACTLLFLCVAMLCAVEDTCAMKQTWQFDRETRREFVVERFGFAPQATMDLRVRDVSFSFTDASKAKPSDAIQAGLLLVHVRAFQWNGTERNGWKC
jgi:hypothetical protein